MKKNYMPPQMMVEYVVLSSHLLSGSVLNMGTEGQPQGGARAPKHENVF